jgi:ComF family protein
MMRIADVVNGCIDVGLELIAPQLCAVCQTATVARRRDGAACAACWQAYQEFHHAHFIMCRRCGRWRRIPEGTPPDARRSVPSCDQCRHLAPDAMRSGGPYSGALRQALLALKRHPVMPTPLRDIIAESWRAFPELRAAEVMTPTPLAERRERRRGYNQAALIADVLAQASGVRVAYDALVRTVETAPHRAGMDDRARARSLEGAFRAPRPRLVAGKCVLLVDDVHTSGATLNACAMALRAAGAASVVAFTAARTMRFSG